jgi:hypothetical protein
MYYKGESPDKDGPAIILFYYTQLEMLMEASWLLNNKWTRRKENSQKRNALWQKKFYKKRIKEALA